MDFHESFVNGFLFCIINDSLGDLIVHQKVKSDQVLSRDLEAGRYKVKVELPPLWLAPGVYTLYFKFIGRKESGIEERHFSERVVLDVTGSVNGISRATLAPPFSWTLAPEPVFEEVQNTV